MQLADQLKDPRIAGARDGAKSRGAKAAVRIVEAAAYW